MNLAGRRSLLEPLLDRGTRDPQSLALVFLGEAGTQEQITAGRLLERAGGYGFGLQQAGVKAGDLVILVMDHSPELIYAFWGALLAGIVPTIFPYLTEKLDPSLYQGRVHKLVEQAQARLVITFPAFQTSLSALLSDLDCRVVEIQELESRGEQPDTSSWVPPQPEQAAFIQYSSGTTGLQKGVVLSHRAILNNVRAIGQAVEIRDDDVVVSWLPLHHDMGLITGLMLPVLAGIPSVLLSPFRWVRDPKTHLRAVQDYHGTVSWMPNFAFNHCANSIRDRDLQGLDLSGWRVLINAGETVRLDSLRLFADRFQPCGFRESSLGAGYGMAEITGAVSITPIGRSPCVDWVQRRVLQEESRAEPAEPERPDSTPLVSSGQLLAGIEVRIVGPAGQTLPERQIGEILVRSNSMLSGYRHGLKLSRAETRGDWYATGDLGYLAEGDLFVTGRLKDLIVTGGRNFFPEDLEAIASTVQGIRPGRAVAFGLEDASLGTEVIVLVCELREELSPPDQLAVERELRRRITRELDVALGAVQFVEKGWVIKTPSGKVARSANRDKFLRLVSAQEEVNERRGGSGRAPA